MARMIRQGIPRINTLVRYYDTSVHCGAIYRAAGWPTDAITRGKDWRNAGRPAESSAGGQPGAGGSLGPRAALKPDPIQRFWTNYQYTA